jgi:hypothetical protein
MRVSGERGPHRLHLAQSVVEDLATGHLGESMAGCCEPVQVADTRPRVEPHHVLAPLAELEDLDSVRNWLARSDLDRDADALVIEPKAGRVAQEVGGQVLGERSGQAPSAAVSVSRSQKELQAWPLVVVP